MRRPDGRKRLEAAAVAALSPTARAALFDARRFERDIDDREDLSPGAAWLAEREKCSGQQALSRYLRSASKRQRCQRARGSFDDTIDEVVDETVIDLEQVFEEVDGGDQVLDASDVHCGSETFSAWQLRQARRARSTLHREVRVRRAGQGELEMPDERVEGVALRQAVAEKLRKPRRKPGRSKTGAPRTNVLPGQLALPL